MSIAYARLPLSERHAALCSDGFVYIQIEWIFVTMRRYMAVSFACVSRKCLRLSSRSFSIVNTVASTTTSKEFCGKRDVF